MKHIFIFVLVFFSISVFSPAFADAGDEDKGIEDSRTFHVYDDVDLVSTLKFEYGKPKIIIKSVYPQLASETERDGIDEFNQASEDIVQEEINQFRRQVKNLESVQKSIPKTQVTNNLYIDYDTSYFKSKMNHIISIRFSIQGFITGMPPFHYHRVINYNLDTSQELELSDLFLPGSNYLSVLSSYTSNILFRQLKKTHSIAFGTASTAKNYSNWNIKSNGILITFDKNKVAPSIYGAQTIFIPFSALTEVMSPDSPIADCIQHRRRCTHTNLLTGGFIDEAVNHQHRTLNPILSKL